MTNTPALKKLMALADRRLEIAERNLARAVEAKDDAAKARVAAKIAFEKTQADMAHQRVAALDKFVGKPTRRVGVSDLLGVLTDQDNAVEDAAQVALDAHNGFEAAKAHVTEMAKAHRAAQLVRQKRITAFEPMLLEVKRRADSVQELEAEEEFGYARRF